MKSMSSETLKPIKGLYQFSRKSIILLLGSKSHFYITLFQMSPFQKVLKYLFRPPKKHINYKKINKFQHASLLASDSVKGLFYILGRFTFLLRVR